MYMNIMIMLFTIDFLLFESRINFSICYEDIDLQSKYNLRNTDMKYCY